MPVSKNGTVAKAAEKAGFRRRVEAALERAHAAADGARDAFLASAALTASGTVADLYGWADVLVIDPSRRLRDTLKEMGETRRQAPGIWYVSSFPRSGGTQSVTANDLACRAACEALARDLQGEGDFTTMTRID